MALNVLLQISYEYFKKASNLLLQKNKSPSKLFQADCDRNAKHC